MAIEELLNEFANDLTQSQLKWIYLLDNFYYENNYLSEKQFNILLNVFSKFETDESAINELITESKYIS